LSYTREQIEAYYRHRLDNVPDATLKDQLYVCCPFHDDTNASLSVNLNTGLWTCHAGCGDGSMVHFEEEFMKKNGTGEGMTAEQCIKEVLAENGLIDEEETAGDAPAFEAKTVYSYRLKDGQETFQSIRTDLANGDKRFYARHQNSEGNWVKGRGNSPHVPYHLPEVLAADVVIVCEGEKCVEFVDSLNLSELWGQMVAATCNAFGAMKWRTELDQYFSGKDVIILPDNDEPGRNHANNVARHLAKVAKEVRILELPGLQDKGDVADFIMMRPQTARQDLVELVREAPLWVEEVAAQSQVPRFLTMKELFLRADAKVRYLVNGLLLKEGISILAAKPKLGKSTLAR
jgi:hypothetical protein